MPGHDDSMVEVPIAIDKEDLAFLDSCGITLQEFCIYVLVQFKLELARHR